MPDNVSGMPDNVNLARSPFGTCFVFGGIPLLIAILSDVLFFSVSGSQFIQYVYPDSLLLVHLFTSLQGSGLFVPVF